ncbi:MAG: AMP-binding protein [Pseudomonadota bacterium]
MNLAAWLIRAAQSFPDLPAVARGTAPLLTYRQLGDKAARLAGGLRHRLGLAEDDRVAIVSKNTPEYIEILYGIWQAGLVAVPINAKLHGAEIGWILEHAGCKALFAGPDLETTLEAHRPDGLQHLVPIGGSDYQALLSADPLPVVARGPDDLAWLFYTSGTTGRPKGAMLTHRNLAAATYGYLIDVDPTAPGDCLVHGAPMSHGSGIYIMGTIARCGLNVVPESGGFDPAELFAIAAHWQRASMFAAPTMIKRLTDFPGDTDPTALRTIVWGGAPMHVADTERALDRFGPCFAQIYGQGETPMTATVLSKSVIADRAHPRWRERLGSAGIANVAAEVRIGDAEGRPLATGETGEIMVRGDTVMAGYWTDAAASAAAIRDGWLYTGDVGAIDADGFLTLKDRSKDVIISGGSNIYPREVEEVLLRHPAVREVSVIGRPDPEWGEIVVAYVAGNAAPEELDALCRDSIARFKRPKDYVLTDALPKNNYGKILKTELRDRDKAKIETTPEEGNT